MATEKDIETRWQIGHLEEHALPLNQPLETAKIKKPTTETQMGCRESERERERDPLFHF